jgi:hypothetical protein
MISEQAICTFALLTIEELEFGVGVALLPGTSPLLPGISVLLSGTVLLSESAGPTGSLFESSEHAENAPSIEIRVPVKSHFFMFIRAILF